MYKPNYQTLLNEVSAERRRDGKAPLPNDLRITITEHVESTIAHIASLPSLTLLYEGNKPAQIDAAVKQYAHELGEGKSFGPQDPHLRDLLTDMPQEAAKPVAPAAGTAPISHLLENPSYMADFKSKVDAVAKDPSDAGYRAAKFLQPQLENISGQKAVIALFTKMDVLVTTQSKKTPKSYAANHKATDMFLGMLTPSQRTLMREQALQDKRSTFQQIRAEIPLNVTTGPATTAGMTRRGLFSTAAGLVAGGTAYLLQQSAYTNQDEALNAPYTADKPVEKGQEHKYFRGPATEAMKQEPNKQQLETANLRQNQSRFAVGTTVAFGIDALVQFGRRAYAVQTAHFKDEVGDILTKMKPMVDESQKEILQAEAERAGRTS